MLLPKSIASCVCVPTFRSLTQKVCLTKIPFVAIFWPDRDTKVGVVIYMYSKYSPRVFLAKIPILAFLITMIIIFQIFWPMF